MSAEANELNAKKQRMQERTLVITFNVVKENQIVVEPEISTLFFFPCDGKLGEIGCKVDNTVIGEQTKFSCKCPSTLVRHCMLLKNVDECFGDVEENVKLVEDNDVDRKELMKKENDFYRVSINTVCTAIDNSSVDLLIGHINQGGHVFDSCTLSADSVFATITVADALQYDNLTQFIDDAVAYIARNRVDDNNNAELCNKYVDMLSKANEENWKVEIDAISALNSFPDPIANMQKLASSNNQ